MNICTSAGIELQVPKHTSSLRYKVKFSLCFTSAVYRQVVGLLHYTMDPLKGSSFSCTVAILLVTVVSLSSVSASNNSRCPTWFYYNSTHQCQCGSWLNCINNKTVLINDGDRATSSGQGDQYYIGNCPFAHPGNRTKFSAEMPSDPDIYANTLLFQGSDYT